MKRLLVFTASPVLRLPRFAKRTIVVLVDVCLCIISTWIALYLSLDEFVNVRNGLFQPALLSIMVAIPICTFNGLYQAIFRHSGWLSIENVARAMAFYSLIYTTIVMIVGIDGTPRILGLLQPLILFVWIAMSRLFARFWLESGSQSQKLVLPRVVIYGAGSAGRQLAVALANGNEMQVLGFIDDDIRLHRNFLNGLKIFAPSELAQLISTLEISHVLLAMPSISRSRRHEILDHISQHRVVVRTLPSITDIAEGIVTISDIKEPDVDDLLGRDPVDPDMTLLARKVAGKVVLVSGAGGSIGGELCRQILPLNPSKLLLVERSEYALYSIHSELESLKARFATSPQVRIIPLLCSVQDRRRVQEIISAWSPDTIYHAAAYKHVPLVEHNLVEGIKNNIFGTLTIANAAMGGGVSDFVLISTDKAVRPTSVMGATKRLAEMTLQALNANGDSKTLFSMVRFGNVLASSGSVIPKFRSQIQDGGPITVTHPEVTRFFMTVTEAAQLVIQASGLAEGGDVFVLDMGEPIKIIDLAERLVNLSGLSIRTLANPEGDIDIKITGLRPGEKLYEELLIGSDVTHTKHPRIMAGREPFIPWSKLHTELVKLEKAADDSDVKTAFSMLKFLVEGFESESDVVDWVWLEGLT